MRRSSRGFEDQLRDFLIGREALQRRLGEQQLPVHRDLESSAAALDEGHAGAVEGAGEFSGQTGRLGCVVSLGAILDRNVHVPRVAGPVRDAGGLVVGGALGGPPGAQGGCPAGLTRPWIGSELRGESHDRAVVDGAHLGAARGTPRVPFRRM